MLSFYEGFLGYLVLFGYWIVCDICVLEPEYRISENVATYIDCPTQWLITAPQIVGGVANLVKYRMIRPDPAFLTSRHIVDCSCGCYGER